MNAERSRITADKPCLPPHNEERARGLLTDLLRDVSRSFYLTLRVLPREIRPQISLAYLLARASDTIADTKALPREKRIDLLRRMQRGETQGIVDLAANQGLPAERALLTKLDQCMTLLRSFSQEDQQRIGNLLHTIVGGQIFDLETFFGETEGELVALANDEELDRYTYMVAGCVGEFWTKMCMAHLKELQHWDATRMGALGVRFGKGLQLVNILRDIPRDLRIGRCYLPAIEPQMLLDPTKFTQVEPLYTRWLDTALEHLDAGWEYTMRIPGSLKRLRLACSWPIWIGLKTIARLRHANPLDATQRIKVSRVEVYWLMGTSFLLAGNDATLDGKYQRLREAAKSARRTP
jgi:farnesyl-diphosphate farnesyltransferase